MKRLLTAIVLLFACTETAICQQWNFTDVTNGYILAKHIRAQKWDGNTLVGDEPAGPSLGYEYFPAVGVPGGAPLDATGTKVLGGQTASLPGNVWSMDATALAIASWTQNVTQDAAVPRIELGFSNTIKGKVGPANNFTRRVVGEAHSAGNIWRVIRCDNQPANASTIKLAEVVMTGTATGTTAILQRASQMQARFGGNEFTATFVPSINKWHVEWSYVDQNGVPQVGSEDVVNLQKTWVCASQIHGQEIFLYDCQVVYDVDDPRDTNGAWTAYNGLLANLQNGQSGFATSCDTTMQGTVKISPGTYLLKKP